MMQPSDLQAIQDYITTHISTFHQKRLESLKALKLKAVLQRKNPYLFKAKNIVTAQDLIKSLLDAFLQSQEETLFGDFMEGVAIFICNQIFGAKKSKLIGIDLEFEKDNILYVIEIKSGPSWGNSSQINQMKDNFAQAIAQLSLTGKQVQAINGCCYGKDNKPHKVGYHKYCGQAFWEFISGNPDTYLDLIEPIGTKAQEKNEAFYTAYAQIINQFTGEFIQDFCTDGLIDWAKLVQFNSGKSAA